MCCLSEQVFDYTNQITATLNFYMRLRNVEGIGKTSKSYIFFYSIFFELKFLDRINAMARHKNIS